MICSLLFLGWFLGRSKSEILSSKPEPNVDNTSNRNEEKPTADYSSTINFHDSFKGYGTEPQTVFDDLTQIYGLLEFYKMEMGNIFPPVTSNKALVDSLSGNNKYKKRFELPNQILKNAELIDRWETPLSFHSLSSRILDVRSAGPDKSMYTEDDIYIETPKKRAAHFLGL